MRMKKHSPESCSGVPARSFLSCSFFITDTYAQYLAVCNWKRKTRQGKHLPGLVFVVGLTHWLTLPARTHCMSAVRYDTSRLVVIGWLTGEARQRDEN